MRDLPDIVFSKMQVICVAREARGSANDYYFSLTFRRKLIKDDSYFLKSLSIRL